MANHPLETATAKENVAFGLRSSAISKLPEIKKVISETINTAIVIP